MDEREDKDENEDESEEFPRAQREMASSTRAATAPRRPLGRNDDDEDEDELTVERGVRVRMEGWVVCPL